MICLSCNSTNVHMVYLPSGSMREARIFECHNCGLVQSKLNKQSRKYKSLSSDADWGNVRHAKPLRLNANRGKLLNLINALPNSPWILDIGASRGHFYDFLNQALAEFRYEGIESDATLPKFDTKNGSVRYSKFEDCRRDLKPCIYDFIFLNHTLEHVDNPRSLLEDCFQLMKESAILWIDVPNISAINDPNVVEEYFIDKHTVHFSKESLKNLLYLVGFTVIQEFSDTLNIVLVCKKNNSSEPRIEFKPECVLIDLNKYANRLIVNRKKLKNIAAKIESDENGLLIFGAGRLLDSLVRFGGLQTERLTICDSYLFSYAAGLSYKIYDPDEISWNSINKVIIMARSSIEEIRMYIEAKCNAQIVFFKDLLEN